jgi:hypothetical protein
VCIEVFFFFFVAFVARTARWVDWCVVLVALFGLVRCDPAASSSLCSLRGTRLSTSLSTCSVASSVRIERLSKAVLSLPFEEAFLQYM